MPLSSDTHTGLRRIAIGIGLLILILGGPLSFHWLRDKFYRPDHPLIGEAYFKCEAKRAVEGGMYGKGPKFRFGSQYCRTWQAISRQEFTALVLEWHGKSLEGELQSRGHATSANSLSSPEARK
jgi:hypothetical protein